MDGFRFDGAVALITGGGSGIGKATAKALAERGARIAITELPGRGAAAKSVVHELSEQGREAIEIALDVTAVQTIPVVVNHVTRHFGRLDILVNNAGTQLLKPALDIEEEEFDHILSVNLKGAFFCAQAAAAAMADRKVGSIVNVASQHGVVGNRKRAAYCASKGGLVNLTRALAIEWADYGIRVNAISPTYVVNDNNQWLIESAEIKEQIGRGVLTGRAVRSEEVAAGICYLASPAAAMITGHNLMVDGGWTAQ
jgi:NAD(P)-dependent dehydrogenase (short-subunit alcohol dehydrogenase family)